MVIPIYFYGHPVLRAVAQPVTPDYPGLAELIQNMKETMYGSDGIGIAAPQVGVSLRLVYIDVNVLGDDMPELKGVHMTLINPEITVDESVATTSREEGCLSLPGIHENVARHEKIHLKWHARVVQHECDHLDGTVFTDRISPIRKQMVRTKLGNILKGKVHCNYRTKGAKPGRK